MIKAVFFDFDGVLTTDPNGTVTITRNLCVAIPGLALEKVQACYRKMRKNIEADGGSVADYWQEFCTGVGVPIMLDVLLDAMGTVPKNVPMFALAESSRDAGYGVGMITDNTCERMELLRKTMRLPELFDPIIVSAEVRAAKHDGTTKIFDLALKGAGCSAQEALFIDNKKDNLLTPEKMGMQTYWHDDTKNDVPALMQALKKYGVEWKSMNV